jgi:hypothetical protein
MIRRLKSMWGRGEILWVYYDQKRRRWYSQGRVE